MVPVVVVDLNEADAAFDHAAGHAARCSRSVPGFLTSSPYSFIRVSGSLARSVSSGTLACMRNAISYCWMRVCVSGSPTCGVVHLVERFEAIERLAADLRGDTGRVVDVENRIAAAAEGDAGSVRRADSPTARAERRSPAPVRCWSAWRPSRRTSAGRR